MMSVISRRISAIRATSQGSIIFHFSALEFFFWAAFSTYYPYVVVFLRENSFSNTTIGVILSINSAIIILAQPFWGFVSDWVRSVKKIFILCMSTAAMLIFALPFFQHVIIIAILAAAITFFESPLQSLLDSWVVRGIQNKPGSNYGFIRLWGSLGFALMALAAGYLVELWGVRRIFMIFAGFTVIVMIICTMQKDEKPVEKSLFKHLNPTQLLKNKPYMFFVIIATLVFIPLRSSMMFIPNLMDQLGGTDRQYGFLFSVSAFSEVPVLLLSGKLIRKFKPQLLIAVALGLFVLRQYLFIIVTTPLQLIMIQSIQGFSFGLFLSGTVYYIYAMAPDNLKATAQTFATSMFFGLSGVLGSYIGGFVIDRFDLKTLYWGGLVLTITGAVLFGFQTMLDHKRQIMSAPD